MNTSITFTVAIVLVTGLSICAITMMRAILLAAVRLDVRTFVHRLVGMGVVIAIAAVVATILGALADPLDVFVP
ncbi:hypothetical protein [Microbacterium marmarense]|uniref:Uncharacterized protein n=1 Tax=Microbacterium marmarense TaxID=3122051 RepID=A0ABU8LRW8_9MICO